MVSVIIVNYHCAKMTAKAAESVYQDDPSAEIIVVDNSVHAEEEERLRSLLPAKALLIVSETNGGFGKGCNLGYARASGEYIFLLNPDTVVIKGCIPQLINTLKSNNITGAVSPLSFWDQHMRFLLPSGQLETPLWETILALGYRSHFLRTLLSHWYRKETVSTLTAKKAVRQNMLSGAHMMIKKEVIDKLDCFFDETFFLYYEDTDLNLRITRAGYHLMMDPVAKVIHFWQSDPAKHQFAPESRSIYINKHFKDSLLWNIKTFIERKAVVFPSDVTDFGKLIDPPTFPTVKGQNGYWEISLNHLFVPSAIHPFTSDFGEDIVIPTDIWNLLGSGEYWARIFSQNGEEHIFKWTIEK